jgi:hypothetical protein
MVGAEYAADELGRAVPDGRGATMSAEGLALASVKTRLHFYRLAQELRMDVARWREWVREAVKEAKRIRAMN